MRHAHRRDPLGEGPDTRPDLCFIPSLCGTYDRVRLLRGKIFDQRVDLGFGRLHQLVRFDDMHIAQPDKAQHVSHVAGGKVDIAVDLGATRSHDQIGRAISAQRFRAIFIIGERAAKAGQLVDPELELR